MLQQPKGRFPFVQTVKEVYNEIPKGAARRMGSFVLVAPDPCSGRKHRYNVIRIEYRTGQATMIGCELPLWHARYVAKRPSEDDGKPIPSGPKSRPKSRPRS